MDSKEFFATLHYEENVFELVEDTKMQFLVYFRAPFTGAGEIVVPAGTKFVARGRMRDDAIYIHPVGPEKELLERMNKQEAALTSSLRHPKVFVEEFGDALMPCHQHGFGVNIPV